MRLFERVRSGAWVNTAIYLGTTVSTSVFGLGTALLMTHLLSPAQFGRIGVFLSVLYIAVPAVSLAAEGLIAVNRSTLNEEQYDRFRRTTVAIGLSMFFVLEAVGLIVWNLGIMRDPLILAAPCFALLRLASTTASTEYIVEKKARAYASLTILNSILAMLLTYAIMSWVSASAGARIAALMLAETVIVLVRYHGRMRLLLQPAFDPTYFRQIVAFGVPSLIGLFGAWGLNESDKLVVSQGAGLEVAGIYTAAAALAMVMMSFNQSLTNALFPALFERLEKRTEPVHTVMLAAIGKFFCLNAAFAVVVASAYAIVKDAVLPLKYASASNFFYALVLASLAIAVFRPISLIIEYFRMARLRAIAIIAGGLSTIVCGAAGLHLSGNPLWAPAGIALGYLVAALILAVSLYRYRINEFIKPAH